MIIEFSTSLMPKKSSTRDLKDFFSICDVENTILTYPPHSILSILILSFSIFIVVNCSRERLLGCVSTGYCNAHIATLLLKIPQEYLY